MQRGEKVAEAASGRDAVPGGMYGDRAVLQGKDMPQEEPRDCHLAV